MSVTQKLSALVDRLGACTVDCQGDITYVNFDGKSESPMITIVPCSDIRARNMTMITVDRHDRYQMRSVILNDQNLVSSDSSGEDLNEISPILEQTMKNWWHQDKLPWRPVWVGYTGGRATLSSNGKALFGLGNTPLFVYKLIEEGEDCDYVTLYRGLRVGIDFARRVGAELAMRATDRIPSSLLAIAVSIMPRAVPMLKKAADQMSAGH